ncbi:BMP family protein [Desertimonas flava]|uniref:BMP family protein n=1 Tax=Desertimonas flava TaxID=2064846 RepID=UPI0019699E26|nr:BMP family protein [Desertimonas flava]
MRIPTLLGAAGLAAATVAAGIVSGTGAASSDAEPLLVYGVYATALEEPWDGAIHTAIEAVAETGAIEYRYVDGLGTADVMERGLRDIIESEDPDLIVGDAFAAEEAVRAVAADYPDTAFAFGSGQAEVAPNFSVFDNWLQDPAYLAGMLAGGLTESNTIGVVAAMPIPEVNRIVNAFVDGVGTVNPDATVKVSFINSFFDPASAGQAAEAQIAQGADVLFAERAGVIEIAEENDLPVIGMMVDQRELAPGHVVTSLVWNMQPTIEALVEQVSSGTYEAQNLAEYSFMVNGGSSIAEINTDIVVEVPEDLLAAVEAQQEAILAGEFTTPVDESEPAGSINAGEAAAASAEGASDSAAPATTS